MGKMLLHAGTSFLLSTSPSSLRGDTFAGTWATDEDDLHRRYGRYLSHRESEREGGKEREEAEREGERTAREGQRTAREAERRGREGERRGRESTERGRARESNW